MGLSLTNSTASLEAVRYDEKTGLVPAIVQDAATGTVLMQAYADREALKRTLDTGWAWFWSRSKQAYWCKGRQSGNVQRVVEVRLDCDGDAVLYLVNPAGPACHTGETSCFYRRIVRKTPVSEVRVQSSMDQSEALSDHSTSRTLSMNSPVQTVLQQLWETITDRHRHRPAGSYTTHLFEAGIDKIAKKVGEEAVETVIAAKNAADRQELGKKELMSESADLVFHLLVLWRAAGVSPGEIALELAQRMS